MIANSLYHMPLTFTTCYEVKVKGIMATGCGTKFVPQLAQKKSKQ